MTTDCSPRSRIWIRRNSLAGPAVVAEQDGCAVAALELDSGRVVADPFAPTVDAIALLTLRRTQLRAPDRPPRRQWAAARARAGTWGRALRSPG